MPELDDSSGAGGDLRAALGSFDRAFQRGRIDEFSAFIADDARLLIHEQPGQSSKEAVAGAFAAVFAVFDTSAYEPRYEIVDVHGDRAYVVASFTEVLRPRDGQPGVRVQGRSVQFWRREEDAQWRVVLLLTSRSAPDEPSE